jgi:hypothetical protein
MEFEGGKGEDWKPRPYQFGVELTGVAPNNSLNPTALSAPLSNLVHLRRA